MQNFAKLFGAIALGLTLLFLQGCATRSVKTVEVPTPVLPPDVLLADCPFVFPDRLETNEDLALLTKSLDDALAQCNVDKAALRTWKQEVLKRFGK